jgi:Outer membrane protein beta-barrel domain
MRLRSAVLLAAAALTATAAFAQDAPKLEVWGDYSYIYFTPQNNDYIKSFSLNGGGGGFAAYLTKYIGIEGEFEGYGSYNHSVNIPPAYCNNSTGCTVIASGNLFTYNVGPIVKWRTPHFEPFVETMFGGAHSNLYGNLYQNCTTADCVLGGKSPSNNAFDFIIGGGLDVPLTHNFAIRPAQFDYILTRFGNDFTHGNNNQSNFRFQAGIEFRM